MREWDIFVRAFSLYAAQRDGWKQDLPWQPVTY